MKQSYESHVRIVPAYHFGVLGILALNFVWSLYRLVRAFSVVSVISFLLAIAFLLLAYFARIFALTVQDRLIRLEMRLRLAPLLPPDLRPRLGEFTVDQLVAMRFASDDELPLLARKVLQEKLSDRTTIKKMVRNWQPDLLRA